MKMNERIIIGIMCCLFIMILFFSYGKSDKNYDYEDITAKIDTTEFNFIGDYGEIEI